MRSRIRTLGVPAEAAEFAEEIRRVFAELGRGFGDSSAGECSPAVDVFEDDEAVRIVVDLPGVDAAEIRIVVKGDVVLIAGEKTPRRGRGDSSFHLVERAVGRFARTVRLPGPCDAGRARATLARGELRVTLPKIVERRGRPIRIPVD